MKLKKIILPVLSLGLMSLTLASCGGTDAKDATISSQNEQISTLETEKTTLNSEIATLRTNISTLEARVTELEASLEEAQNSEDKVTISELRGQIKTLNATIKSLETAALEDEDTISTLETDKDNLTLQVSNLNTQVTELTNQIETLTSANETLTSQKTALETEKAELEAQIELYEASGMTTDEKDAQIVSLQTELNDTKTQLASLQTEYERVSSELVSANEQIAELQESASQVVSQVAEYVSKYNIVTIDYSFETNEIYSVLPEGVSSQIDYTNFQKQTCYLPLPTQYNSTIETKLQVISQVILTVKEYDEEYVNENNIASLYPNNWDLNSSGKAVYKNYIFEWTNTNNEGVIITETVSGIDFNNEDYIKQSEKERYNLSSDASFTSKTQFSSDLVQMYATYHNFSNLMNKENTFYFLKNETIISSKIVQSYIPVTISVYSQAFSTSDNDIIENYSNYSNSTMSQEFSKIDLISNQTYTGSFQNINYITSGYIAKGSKSNCLVNKYTYFEENINNIETISEDEIDYSISGKYYTDYVENNKNLVVVINTYFLTDASSNFIYDATEPTLTYGE